MATKKRKGMRPSTRFEVFKRDKFTCQYCGRMAPEVVLRVDHIHPVSQGGEDDLLNLATACFDCNAGKGAKLLSDESALAKQRDQLEQLQERREQLDMMVQWKTELANIDQEVVGKIAAFYSQSVPGWALNAGGIGELKLLVSKYGAAEVMDAITVAANRLAKIGEDGKVTKDTVHEVWSYIPRVLGVRALDKRSPGMGDLFYARGIARKRCGYFKDWKALSLLKEAHAEGADPEELKDIARQCTSWTHWSGLMDTLIDRLRNESERF